MKKLFWIIYGLLIGPIEFLIVRLFTEKMSFIKTIGIMALFSLLYLIIPLIIRLILKKFNKDFYGQIPMYITNAFGIVSIAISWTIILIMEVSGDGIGNLILALIVSGILIFIHYKVLWFIYHMIYGYEISIK